MVVHGVQTGRNLFGVPPLSSLPTQHGAGLYSPEMLATRPSPANWQSSQGEAAGLRMMSSSRCARGRHIEPPLPSEHALFLQSLAHYDNFWVVDQQERKRHAANLGQGLQLTAIPDKVLRPNVAPGMEQADDLTGFGIDSSDVRPLEPELARQGKLSGEDQAELDS